MHNTAEQSLPNRVPSFQQTGKRNEKGLLMRGYLTGRRKLQSAFGREVGSAARIEFCPFLVHQRLLEFIQHKLIIIDERGVALVLVLQRLIGRRDDCGGEEPRIRIIFRLGVIGVDGIFSHHHRLHLVLLEVHEEGTQRRESPELGAFLQPPHGNDGHMLQLRTADLGGAELATDEEVAVGEIGDVGAAALHEQLVEEIRLHGLRLLDDAREGDAEAAENGASRATQRVHHAAALSLPASVDFGEDIGEASHVVGFQRLAAFHALEVVASLGVEEEVGEALDEVSERIGGGVAGIQFPDVVFVVEDEQTVFQLLLCEDTLCEVGGLCVWCVV